MSDIRDVSDINKVLSKSNGPNMRKLTLNIGKTRWNADICKKINLHANFLWLSMIRTINSFLMAQWFSLIFIKFYLNKIRSSEAIKSGGRWIGFWAIDTRNQPNSCRQNTVCTISHASLQPWNINCFLK